MNIPLQQTILHFTTNPLPKVGIIAPVELQKYVENNLLQVRSSGSKPQRLCFNTLEYSQFTNYRTSSQPTVVVDESLTLENFGISSIPSSGLQRAPPKSVSFLKEWLVHALYRCPSTYLLCIDWQSFPLTNYSPQTKGLSRTTIHSAYSNDEKAHISHLEISATNLIEAIRPILRSQKRNLKMIVCVILPSQLSSYNPQQIIGALKKLSHNDIVGFYPMFGMGDKNPIFDKIESALNEQALTFYSIESKKVKTYTASWSSETSAELQFRTLLQSGTVNELAGQFEDAIKDYSIALMLAAHDTLYDDLTSMIFCSVVACRIVHVYLKTENFYKALHYIKTFQNFQFKEQYEKLQILWNAFLYQFILTQSEKENVLPRRPHSSNAILTAAIEFNLALQRITMQFELESSIQGSRFVSQIHEFFSWAILIFMDLEDRMLKPLPTNVITIEYKAPFPISKKFSFNDYKIILNRRCQFLIGKMHMCLKEKNFLRGCTTARMALADLSVTMDEYDKAFLIYHKIYDRRIADLNKTSPPSTLAITPQYIKEHSTCITDQLTKRTFLPCRAWTFDALVILRLLLCCLHFINLSFPETLLEHLENLSFNQTNILSLALKVNSVLAQSSNSDSIKKCEFPANWTLPKFFQLAADALFHLISMNPMLKEKIVYEISTIEWVFDGILQTSKKDDKYGDMAAFSIPVNQLYADCVTEVVDIKNSIAPTNSNDLSNELRLYTTEHDLADGIYSKCHLFRTISPQPLDLGNDFFFRVTIKITNSLNMDLQIRSLTIETDIGPLTFTTRSDWTLYHLDSLNFTEYPMHLEAKHRPAWVTDNDFYLLDLTYNSFAPRVTSSLVKDHLVIEPLIRDDDNQEVPTSSSSLVFKSKKSCMIRFCIHSKKCRQLRIHQLLFGIQATDKIYLLLKNVTLGNLNLKREVFQYRQVAHEVEAAFPRVDASYIKNMQFFSPYILDKVPYMISLKDTELLNKMRGGLSISVKPAGRFYSKVISPLLLEVQSELSWSNLGPCTVTVSIKCMKDGAPSQFIRPFIIKFVPSNKKKMQSLLYDSFSMNAFPNAGSVTVVIPSPNCITHNQIDECSNLTYQKPSLFPPNDLAKFPLFCCLNSPIKQQVEQSSSSESELEEYEEVLDSQLFLDEDFNYKEDDHAQEYESHIPNSECDSENSGHIHNVQRGCNSTDASPMYKVEEYSNSTMTSQKEVEAVETSPSQEGKAESGQATNLSLKNSINYQPQGKNPQNELQAKNIQKNEPQAKNVQKNEPQAKNTQNELQEKKTQIESQAKKTQIEPQAKDVQKNKPQANKPQIEPQAKHVQKNELQAKNTQNELQAKKTQIESQTKNTQIKLPATSSNAPIISGNEVKSNVVNKPTEKEDANSSTNSKVSSDTTEEKEDKVEEKQTSDCSEVDDIFADDPFDLEFTSSALKGSIKEVIIKKEKEMEQTLSSQTDTSTQKNVDCNKDAAAQKTSPSSSAPGKDAMLNKESEKEMKESVKPSSISKASLAPKQPHLQKASLPKSMIAGADPKAISSAKAQNKSDCSPSKPLIAGENAKVVSSAKEPRSSDIGMQKPLIAGASIAPPRKEALPKMAGATIKQSNANGCMNGNRVGAVISNDKNKVLNINTQGKPKQERERNAVEPKEIKEEIKVGNNHQTQMGHSSNNTESSTKPFVEDSQLDNDVDIEKICPSRDVDDKISSTIPYTKKLSFGDRPIKKISVEKSSKKSAKKATTHYDASLPLIPIFSMPFLMLSNAVTDGEVIADVNVAFSEYAINQINQSIRIHFEAPFDIQVELPSAYGCTNLRGLQLAHVRITNLMHTTILVKNIMLAEMPRKGIAKFTQDHPWSKINELLFAGEAPLVPNAYWLGVLNCSLLPAHATHYRIQIQFHVIKSAGLPKPMDRMYSQIKHSYEQTLVVEKWADVCPMNAASYNFEFEQCAVVGQAMPYKFVIHNNRNVHLEAAVVLQTTSVSKNSSNDCPSYKSAKWLKNFFISGNMKHTILVPPMQFRSVQWVLVPINIGKHHLPSVVVNVSEEYKELFPEFSSKLEITIPFIHINLPIFKPIENRSRVEKVKPTAA